jgi:hypothetical protein
MELTLKLPGGRVQETTTGTGYDAAPSAATVQAGVDRMMTSTLTWNGANRFHSISCACSGCLWLDEFLFSARAAPTFEIPPTDPVPAVGRGCDFPPAE